MTSSPFNHPGLRQLPVNDVISLFGSEHTTYVYEHLGVPLLDNLDPRELAAVTGAALRRVHTFAAGRLCAHAALKARGMDRTPLLPRADGQVDWPAEAPGTIAHTDGYAIAAVLADPKLHVAIGIDVEVLGAVSDDVIEIAFTPAERERLGTLEAAARIRTATIMFCAKEAFYKAQFQLTGAWIDFHDVEVSVASTGISLHPTTNREALGMFRWPLSGGYAVREGVVIVATLIPTTRFIALPCL